MYMYSLKFICTVVHVYVLLQMYTCTYVYFGPYQVAYWLKHIPSAFQVNPHHKPYTLGIPTVGFQQELYSQM